MLRNRSSAAWVVAKVLQDMYGFAARMVGISLICWDFEMILLEYFVLDALGINAPGIDCSADRQQRFVERAATFFEASRSNFW